MLEWLEIAGAAGQYLDEEENRKWLKDRYDRTLDYILKGETQIAIFGAGGVGKTRFSKLLMAEDPMALTPGYGADVTVKDDPLPGNLSARLLVAPGQRIFVDQEWPDVFKILQAARSVFVVNVVAYGYHAIDGTGFKSNPQFAELGTSDAAAQQYFTDRRQVELARFQDLAKGLENLTRPFRMLTLVAKEDLWADRRDEVQAHYGDLETSAYAQAVQDLAEKFEANGVKMYHNFLPVAQISENLVTPKGDLLVPTVAGFDGARRRNSVYGALRYFTDLLGRK